MNCLQLENIVKYNYELINPYQNMRRDNYGIG